MAQPTAFREAKALLSPPLAAPDERLPVHVVDGRIVSCWKLTLAEIEEIVTTGVVWLAVWGRQPTVTVTGHKAEVV
jgi:hypothetical protein